MREISFCKYPSLSLVAILGKDSDKGKNAYGEGPARA